MIFHTLLSVFHTVFNTCGKHVDSFDVLHCFPHLFGCFCLYVMPNCCGLPKRAKSGKLKKTGFFINFFSFFPQEFSTLWLCATRLYKKKEQKALSKWHLLHTSFLLAHFYQPFFHTNGHAKNTKIQIHISHFVPFHSFRRHY